MADVTLTAEQLAEYRAIGIAAMKAAAPAGDYDPIGHVYGPGLVALADALAAARNDAVAASDDSESHRRDADELREHYEPELRQDTVAHIAEVGLTAFLRAQRHEAADYGEDETAAQWWAALVAASEARDRQLAAAREAKCVVCDRNPDGKLADALEAAQQDTARLDALRGLYRIEIAEFSCPQCPQPDCSVRHWVGVQRYNGPTFQGHSPEDLADALLAQQGGGAGA